jgi:lysophospholipid acyltransferase (LPLAT)-like uncharacterized protein
MIRAKILSFIAWVVVMLWSRSLKILRVNRDVHGRIAEEGRNVVYAFWHDSMFLLPYTHRNSGIVIAVSESRDGDLAARMLRHFGLEVIRGSTKRKGNRALIGLINNIRRGRSVAIAVDGPRGPRHEAKAGAVFLAGRLMVPVIPVVTRVKRCLILEKAWDKFIVPAPFTKGVILYGEPIMVSGTSSEEIEAKRRELGSSLCRLTQEAEALVAAPGHGKRSAIKNESSPARLCEKDRQRRAGASRL